MKLYNILKLFLVFGLKGVVAEADNEIKRKGIFPFMAFIYYPDANVVDESGIRFSRAGVLIHPEWVLTASLERNDFALAFPQKTLIARLGAVTIDANFTYNEDEEEQEREIIQIVRPSNFNTAEWWFNDISLLKTLVAFNITLVVAPTIPQYKPEQTDRTCKILIFAKRSSNVTDDRVLMQLSVELLLPTTDCGIYHNMNSMLCGADSDDNKHFLYDDKYCEGNSGGPLLCEGEVTGLQTYVDNNCKQLHLYQSLSAWKSFITCVTNEKCMEGSCMNSCYMINKDTPVNEIVVPSSVEPVVFLVSQTHNASTLTSPTSSSMATTQVTEITSDETDPPPPTLTTITEEQKTKENNVMSLAVKAAHREEEDQPILTTWPNEIYKEKQKDADQLDEMANVERKPTLEAQQQTLPKARSWAANGMYLPQNLFFSIITLTCLM